MEEFCALRAKTWAYLINVYNDDYDEEKIINKKAKTTKKCVTKYRLMFENYTDSLFNDNIILKSQQVFRSENHDVYTVEIKIVLSSNDDKRLQTLDRVTTYPHGTNVLKVCESETMIARDLFFSKN